jgi:uncharacterized YccA/Bax inhibitor family protein
VLPALVLIYVSVEGVFFGASSFLQEEKTNKKAKNIRGAFIFLNLGFANIKRWI